MYTPDCDRIIQGSTDIVKVYQGNTVVWEKIMVPLNELWYTSVNDVVINPLEHFGEANIVSNVYEDGLGVITFDRNLEIIGEDAFQNKNIVSIKIPNGVTAIDYMAFKNCIALSSVKLGNSITTIDGWAFSLCSSLQDITIPYSVTTIYRNAFEYCGLTSLFLPSSVTTMGMEVFRGCTALTSIIVDTENPVYDSRNNCNAIIETATNTLIQGCNYTVFPNDITKIGAGSFEKCSFTSITIPDSVTSIGDFAFVDCTALSNVTLGNNLLFIFNAAFENCISLTSITIPDSVESLYGCFFDCSSLSNVTLGSGITTLGYNVFRGCTALSSITIPNGVTIIESNAFYGCTALLNITIPDTNKRIEESAFSGCTALSSITIGSGATYIGKTILSDCVSLSSINYNGTKTQWNAITKSTTWKSGIPATVTVVHCTDGDVNI